MAFLLQTFQNYTSCSTCGRMTGNRAEVKTTMKACADCKVCVELIQPETWLTPYLSDHTLLFRKLPDYRLETRPFVNEPLYEQTRLLVCLDKKMCSRLDSTTKSLRNYNEAILTDHEEMAGYAEFLRQQQRASPKHR